MDHSYEFVWLMLERKVIHWNELFRQYFVVSELLFFMPNPFWKYTVRFERDVIGQMEALHQLVDYPVEQTIKALKETIESLDYYWRVRCLACEIMYKVTNRMPNPDSGKDALLKIYTDFFCLSDSVSKVQ